jgi:hypothetical protein
MLGSIFIEQGIFDLEQRIGRGCAGKIFSGQGSIHSDGQTANGDLGIAFSHSIGAKPERRLVELGISRVVVKLNLRSIHPHPPSCDLSQLVLLARYNGDVAGSDRQASPEAIDHDQEITVTSQTIDGAPLNEVCGLVPRRVSGVRGNSGRGALGTVGYRFDP